MARLTTYERWDRSNVVHRMLFGWGLISESEIVKGFEDAILNAGKLTVFFWWLKKFPLHFNRDAHGRFGYADRKRWYIFKKMKKFPENRGIDLIYTGNLRSIATTAPRHAPRGEKKFNGFLFKIGVMTTKYVAQNRHISMHRELTAVDLRDIREVADMLRGLLAIGLGYAKI